MYKKSNGSIVRIMDGASIPDDSANLDYAEYLRWVAEGNAPEIEVDMPDTKIAALRHAVQNLLDEKAQEHGYDSILSATSYAAGPNKYQEEGIAFLSWRGACWEYCENLLAQGGELPSEDVLLAGLPALVL